MQIKLQMQEEAESQLDKELEAILGRAVTMEDLEALYLQDLKLLGVIEAGLENKIGKFRQLLAARYVQKAWRGYVARKLVKRKKAQMKECMLKHGAFIGKNKKFRERRAALIIAKKWKEYQARKKANVADKAPQQIQATSQSLPKQSVAEKKNFWKELSQE